MNDNKIEHNMDALRNLNKKIHPEINFDREFELYYDESNNIRKFSIKNREFNVSKDFNFLLGGVFFNEGDSFIENLYSDLGFQSNQMELKFSNVAKGDFPSCLKSRKLKTFLSYLLENNVGIHYMNINFLYFSLVDIVDSAVAEVIEEIPISDNLILHMKNSLYEVVTEELEEVLKIFNKFKYPNISDDKIERFIEELFCLIEKYENDPRHHIYLVSLRQILKESKKKNHLSFLQDNKDYILIEKFCNFYIERIYMFCKSYHTFDNEVIIEDFLKKNMITLNGKEISNYKFIDSKDDRKIQISDILIGFVSKLFNFLSSLSKQEFSSFLVSLEGEQLDILNLYFKLLLKSEKICRGLIFNSTSLAELWRLESLYEYVCNKTNLKF